MSLTPPKRLFHVPSMSTVMYEDVVDDVKEKGYAAVSHVWGDQKLYSAGELGIKCGANWEIPLSNPDKIRRLKNAMKKFKMEWCWFDVLCMPQGEENQGEVNKEIPFMGDYYNGAKMTLVLSSKKYPEDDPNRMLRNGIVKGITGIAKVSMIAQYVAMELYEDTWFHRLWTFQEAVMSKQIWLVSAFGTYLDISDIMEHRVSYADKYENSASDELINSLARAMKDYRDHKTNMGRMLYECRNRECYKPEDKLYGTLGVLGYTNFPVVYGMDMKDLMRKFMEHAYYNRDVSWLAIHVNGATGFVPSHGTLVYIGKLWKEEKLGICDIKIMENTLRMNASIAADVVCSVDISENSEEPYDTYKEWGFGESDISRCMTGHCKLSDRELEELESFHKSCPDRSHSSLSLIKGIGSFLVGGNTGNLHIKRLRHMDIKWNTTVKVICTKTRETLLMKVCGECNVGDKIMILPMHDAYERILGIVVDDNFKRKGICLYPKLDTRYEYTLHEFPL